MARTSTTWRRFSLRTFFLVVTAFCILFGWWASHALRQRDIVLALEKLGGHVEYDDHFQFAPRYETVKIGFTYRTKVIPPPPKSWLRQTLGDDWFANVRRAYLRGSAVTNDDVKRAAPLLAQLPRLDRLDLDYGSIDGRGLRPLAEIKQLEFLGLYNTGILIVDPHVIELQRRLPRLHISY